MARVMFGYLAFPPVVRILRGAIETHIGSVKVRERS